MRSCLSLWTGLLIPLLLLSTPAPAWAWNVRGPASDPCHERLTLGALGAAPSGWQQIPKMSGEELLAQWVAVAEKTGGPPSDRPTQYWVQELSNQHGLTARPFLEQYVLASFVAGVRAPDFNGLHPSQISKIRALHVGDERQPHHALRRSKDAAGERGDVSALHASREWILERLESAQELRLNRQTYRIRESVPHYGDVTVQVLAPAYELGVAAHALQDAFSHTLRDDDFRVVAVLNWVDAVEGNHDHRQSGSPHSDRLDECNLSNSFDEMRYRAAQAATLNLFRETTEPLTPLKGRPGESVLSEAFDYRAGCNLDNHYCDSSWYPVAMEKPTGPFSWAACAYSPAPRDGWSAPAMGRVALWVLLMVLVGFVVRARNKAGAGPQ